MIDEKDFEDMLKLNTNFVGCSILCHNCNRVFFSPIKGTIDDFLTNLGFNGCPECEQVKNKENKILEPIKWYTQQEMDFYEMMHQGLIKTVFFDDDGKTS